MRSQCTNVQSGREKTEELNFSCKGKQELQFTGDAYHQR